MGERQRAEEEVRQLAEEVRRATAGRVQVDGVTLERERLVGMVAFDRRMARWEGGSALLKLQGGRARCSLPLEPFLFAPARTVSAASIKAQVRRRSLQSVTVDAKGDEKATELCA